MAEYNHSYRMPGMVAAVDLSAHRYHFGRMTDTDTVSYANASDDESIIGIIESCGQAGDDIAVVYEGFSKITVGSSVNVGDLLMSTTGATAATCSSGYTAIGRALTAGSPGEVISCQVFRPWQMAF